MIFNVEKIYPKYKFNISGVSYIGSPKDNTVMYVSHKVCQLIDNLKNRKECLVFAENGIIIDKEIMSKNGVVYTDNPQLEYAKFVNILEKEMNREEKRRSYILTDEGYYLGENTSIEDDVYIEPGCLIGHDVVIGKGTHILSGAVIKNAVIGKDALINENALIGANGFTITEDDAGNKIRIPSLGKVIIGNCVEIGANNNISRGSCDNTVIDNYTKLDAFVYIGHDVHLEENVEIVAGAIVGGFTTVGRNSFLGFNSAVKNRIIIESDAVIGMGATVLKSVDRGITVAGNPAKLLHN